jgi:competence protein ComEA
MDLSDFQRKAIILIFISILAGSILLARKEPLKTQNNKEIIEKTPQQKAQITHLSEKIDINTADINTIIQLPGIGPSLASEIINYREKYGPFTSIEELDSIPGIGEKKLSRIKDFIDLPEKNIEEPQTETALKESTSNKLKITQSKINLNTANNKELSAIPGIGPNIAELIIDYRTKNGQLTNIEELNNIPGIGEKRLAKIKEYVFIESLSNSTEKQNNPDADKKSKENTSFKTTKNTYDSRIDPKIKCPFCGKQLWEEGSRKIAYIRCPHCLKLLT